MRKEDEEGGGGVEKEKINRKLKGLKGRKKEVEGKRVRLDRMRDGR
jgi:hypothetical protein